MYNPYIKGKHVYLRHPTEEDAIGAWHEWFSDEEIVKYGWQEAIDLAIRCTERRNGIKALFWIPTPPKEA